MGKRTNKTQHFGQRPPSHAVDHDVIALERCLKAANHDEVERVSRKLLQRLPSHPYGLKALATSLIIRKRHAEALPLLQQALVVTPRDTELHANLGIVLMESGKSDEAVASFDMAIALAPTDPDNFANLATAEVHRAHYAAAETACRQALVLRPNHFVAWNALGATLIKLERYDEALGALSKAIEFYPGDYYQDATENLGEVLVRMRKYQEAHALYGELHALHPDNNYSLTQLALCSLNLCRWEVYAQHLDLLLTRAQQSANTTVPPSVYLSLENFDGASQRQLASSYAAAALVGHLNSPAIFSARGRTVSQARKLKIGYLSADLRTHPVAQLLAGILECRDRARTEVFAYSIGLGDGSALRQRIISAVDVFHDIHPLSHEAAAQLIAQDGIDVLVDLMGWTTSSRLEILALRPAPVQVSWLGYPGTVGDRRLADYLIGDPIVTPLEHADWYAETLALMPHTLQPNDRKRAIGAKPTRTEAGLPDTGFVFCSFSQSYKINPSVFDLWCKLLTAVDGSVLWLLGFSETVRENLRSQALVRGVDPTRLIFAQYAPSLEDHLGRLQCADLALDTFPYGSHTTGSDALWAGVPLVTYLGNTLANRVSSSLVTAAGLPELMTKSREAYFDLALRLATHPDELGKIRQRLAQNRLTCPLFDTERFTRDLERMFETMWRNHSAGVKAPIVLAADGATPVTT
jgi:protein O-GlcNAc transferase